MNEDEKPQLPSNLIQISNEHEVEEGRRISIADFVTQHRKRWQFKTSVGDIILKKLGQLELEETIMRIVEKYPGYLKLISKAEMLLERSKVNGLTAEQTTYLAGLGKQLRPYAKLISLNCFENPKIKTVEEFDALMSALKPDEQAVIYQSLTQLSHFVDVTVDSSIIMLLKNNSIPLAADLTAENMTAEQSKALEKAAADEAKAITDLIAP